MRTLGLLGGMSWESTAEYYRLINRGVAKRLGGRHSARLLMHSLDFDDLEVLQRRLQLPERTLVRPAIIAQDGAGIGVAGGQAVIGAAAILAVDFDAHVHASAIGRASPLRNVDGPLTL